MHEPPSFDAALRTVYREALHLDRREWKQWLALYTEECVFWVPSWRDETTLVEDPRREISFIYAASRKVLEERVSRIAGGKSITMVPPVRTVHAISNPLEEPASQAGRRRIVSAWTNHVFDPRRQSPKVLFGHYEHELVGGPGGEVRIASKKVVLANDEVETVLDIYSI
jgi:3-phenylpropionate/cinnamic acid dioxygenase small subunit